MVLPFVKNRNTDIKNKIEIMYSRRQGIKENEKEAFKW